MPVEVKVPSVGESITEVQIGQWRKAEGDAVEQDEPLIELESEKATFDVPAPAAGVISKLLKQPGDTAAVGEVIAHIDEGAAPVGQREQRSAASQRDASARSAASQRYASDGTRERLAASQRDASEGERPKAADKPGGKKPAQKPEPERTARPAPDHPAESPRVMPAAARALVQHGLRPEDVEGSGPGGRILKEDVLKHAQRTKAAPQPAKAELRRAPEPRSVRTEGDREEETVPMSTIRRRIAQRLVEAQQNAALLTTFNEVDMSAVMELRQKYKDAYQERYGIKLGFMSFFVKAVIEALRQFPQINAEIRESEIVYKNYYDIGIAIGGGKGLVVPILRSAERMSFAEIEQAIADFAVRARENKLMPDELQGGTFTISNGGVYGSLLSTPIVNPPQSGVLGMHAIQDRPVARGGQIVVRPMMYVALTYDHRIVDGREAVQFLARIKDFVEEPANLLLVS